MKKDSEEKNKKTLLFWRGFISLIFCYGLSLVAIASLFVLIEPAELKTATHDDSITVTTTVLGTISVSSPADVTMSPNITGTGTANGSATWNVFTSNASGWKLEVEASASPAMSDGSGNIFDDYTESVSGTPEAWSVSASDSEFGFTASGDNVIADYSSGTLYEGFKGTTKIEVATDSSNTSGGGVDTTVGFRAEVGSSKIQVSGTYTATITATATTL